MIDEPAARLLKFFQYAHLPDHLQKISAEFKDLAEWSVENVQPGAERTVGLRKLLEAKDCMVRAQLP
ncbi:MAG: hypothetical protein DMF56_27095 [Acidobacteria bacterium]|nr:MAG: hypothetical protein DMF56_27095 [Acidobacteriota bacterium]